MKCSIKGNYVSMYVCMYACYFMLINNGSNISPVIDTITKA